MFEKNQKRAAKQARALRRKSERHGVTLSGREATRYNRVSGQSKSVKYATAYAEADYQDAEANWS
jgi:hypothetical protein